MHMSQEQQSVCHDWKDIFLATGALWTHDGDPTSPHAIVRSGLHTSRYLITDRVAERPRLIDMAAHDIVEKLIDASIDIASIDRIVSPAMSAITIGHSVALRISHKTGRECFFSVVTIRGDDLESAAVFEQTTVPRKGELCLIVEDVIITGHTNWLVSRAIQSLGARVLPCDASIVNRSGASQIEGHDIASAFTLDITGSQWKPNDCPLCAAGSEAIPRAKLPQNWARLTARRVR